MTTPRCRPCPLPSCRTVGCPIREPPSLPVYRHCGRADRERAGHRETRPPTMSWVMAASSDAPPYTSLQWARCLTADCHPLRSPMSGGRLLPRQPSPDLHHPSLPELSRNPQNLHPHRQSLHFHTLKRRCFLDHGSWVNFCSFRYPISPSSS